MFMQYRRLSACQLNKAIDCQPCYRLQNNDTIMSELQILQNKDAKVPLGQPPRSLSTEALRSLDLKSLSARRFFHRCIATTSAWLGKLILTLIFSKIKLSIHITQDVPMMFVYPFLELTGVNNLSSFERLEQSSNWSERNTFLIYF